MSDDVASREKVASMCIRRHQAFALLPVRERRFHVCEEAPGFRDDMASSMRQTVPAQFLVRALLVGGHDVHELEPRALVVRAQQLPAVRVYLLHARQGSEERGRHVLAQGAGCAPLPQRRVGQAAEGGVRVHDHRNR